MRRSAAFAKERAGSVPARGGRHLMRRLERAAFEKGDTRRSAARPGVSGKTAFFPRNDRPYGLKSKAFQAENALKNLKRAEEAAASGAAFFADALAPAACCRAGACRAKAEAQVLPCALRIREPQRRAPCGSAPLRPRSLPVPLPVRPHSSPYGNRAGRASRKSPYCAT